MHASVKLALARPAGGRWRFVVHLAMVSAALATAAPAAGQAVPETAGEAVPETVGGVVGDVVNTPLPQPAEDVVQGTPVAPILDEVRRVLDQTAGAPAGGGGGSGSGSPAGGASTGRGAGGGSGTANGGSRTSTGDSGRTGRRRGRGGGRRGFARSGRAGTRRGAALRAASGTTPGRGTAGLVRHAAAGSGNGRATPAKTDRDTAPAVIRTIRTAVRAVPTAIWIALGVLSLLAVGLAARTGIEQRNARMLARDREQLLGDVAALERALLPAVPERIGGACVSVAYRSSEGPAAGGDFYDAFELSDDGRAAVIVGDIAGHGPDALEGTNSMRAQLHALLYTGLSPRAAIATVGERSPVQLAGRFSTVVVAVHHPDAGTLTFATAGHAPPIVIGSGAEELLAAGASPPIGVGLRTGVRETTIALPAGSTCCFYTDGLVEAKNGDGMVGRGRLTELVAALGPDDQADVLLERLLAETSDASDDMTVCLFRPLHRTAARSPRVELLELDGEDVDSGFAARFLDACGMPETEATALVEQARELVAASGLAVLEVTLERGVSTARVTAAAQQAAV
jgi:Stage II sporulation protein E (SpoIIE)